MTMQRRKTKTTTLNESVGRIKSGMVIGLSGFSYMNPPMAFAREIIKKKIKNLTVVSGPTSGIETDVLIGAGCVKKLVTSCVSFEKIESVAPNFRKAAESAGIEIWECDESIWHVALKAGIYGMPYMLWRGGIGSSIPELNREIKEVRVDGKKYLKIPQIKIDLSFLHCGLSDAYGNVQFPENIFLGRLFCEQELAEASKQVVCSVEKIISNELIVKNAHRTIIRNASVIELPFGAHPGASNGFYVPDLNHYREYARLCKEDKFGKYLDKYVFSSGNHEDYMKIIGKDNLERLNFRLKR